MPIMNGWQFLESFEEMGFKKRPTVYILSSSIMKKDKVKAESFKSVGGYIVKPISLRSARKISLQHLSCARKSFLVPRLCCGLLAGQKIEFLKQTEHKTGS